MSNWQSDDYAWTIERGNRIPRQSSKRARRLGSNVISTSLIVAAFFGFLLVVLLIVDSGVAEVAHAMLVLGWWLLPISLFQLVPLSFSALSGRELMPASSRPDVVSVLWIRWIRES